MEREKVTQSLRNCRKERRRRGKLLDVSQKLGGTDEGLGARQSPGEEFQGRQISGIPFLARRGRSPS